MARKKKNRNASTSGSRSRRDRHSEAVNLERSVHDFSHLDPLKPSELFKMGLHREFRSQAHRLKKAVRPDLDVIEDLRRVPKAYNRIKTFLTRSGRVARTEIRPSDNVQESWLRAPLHTYFRDPLRAIVCVRRETRKRVLFALRRVGKGKAVSRDRHFSEQSYIRCK